MTPTTPLPPGIAAGHPATAAVGLEALADGGTAADAAVAASLASCAVEVVMTGLAGGGHAIWWDAERGRAEHLDFFVAMPGLGGARPDAEVVELAVPFGSEIVHYAIGIASCGVPGVVAGLDEVWRRHGRLSWERLCAPAIALAREGVALPPAHAACLAMLAPVMTMREGAEIFLREDGVLKDAGEELRQPGLARALEAVAGEGPRAFRPDGTLGRALLALCDERNGLVTADDLAAYRPVWREPAGLAYAGTRILTREALTPLAPVLSSLPRLRGAPPARRALALARALSGPDVVGSGHTTNLVTADAAGNVCVLTTSLGLGSGDFLPEFQVHLNSMLGESDLLGARLEPGERMASMMSPLVALDAAGVALAAGSAGGTRIRSALAQVTAGVLDEGLPPQDAVDRPRLHRVGRVVHVEPGFEPEALEAVEGAGLTVTPWPARHHYFGGVSLVSRAGGGADPRRSGAALALEAAAGAGPAGSQPR